jgi:hypothetical protein
MRQDSTWEDIARQFEAKRDLFSMRLETDEEALGARLGKKWGDTGPRWDGLRPWLQIPYSKERDQGLLELALESGRDQIETLEAVIAQRKCGPSFAGKWGLFMFCAGVVEAAYFSKQADMHPERQAQARKQDTHKLWVAHALRHLGWSPGQNRKPFENAICSYVKERLGQASTLSPPFDADWYNRLLPKTKAATKAEKDRGPPALRRTFIASGHFKDEEVVRLWDVEEELPPLPPKPQSWN